VPFFFILLEAWLAGVIALEDVPPVVVSALPPQPAKAIAAPTASTVPAWGTRFARIVTPFVADHGNARREM
jgi:hypothetical protein